MSHLLYLHDANLLMGVATSDAVCIAPPTNAKSYGLCLSAGLPEPLIFFSRNYRLRTIPFAVAEPKADPGSVGVELWQAE